MLSKVLIPMVPPAPLVNRCKSLPFSWKTRPKEVVMVETGVRNKHVLQIRSDKTA